MLKRNSNLHRNQGDVGSASYPLGMLTLTTVSTSREMVDWGERKGLVPSRSLFLVPRKWKAGQGLVLT